MINTSKIYDDMTHNDDLITFYLLLLNTLNVILFNYIP